MITDHSSLSFIHPEAKIGAGVQILPFCYIDRDVIIGDNCHIGPNVTILSGSRLGRDCKVFPGAVLGAIPQDLKFQGEYSTLVIGDYTIIRECVTLNRGTVQSGRTYIGNQCLLMAYVHVAHDCRIGNKVVLSNGVQLAGHVDIDDFATLGGNVLVQQFCKIGRFTFIAGASLVRNNVPPFVKVAREPLSYMGINKIGLERNGFSVEEISLVTSIYRILFVQNKNLKKAVDICNQEFSSDLNDEILNFIKNSKSLISGFKSIPIHDDNED